MKVLNLGPSSKRSKGGMATVLKEIEDDSEFCKQCNIETFETFIDGSLIKRFFFSIIAYLRFVITKSSYDIYHIHVASRGSTFRKGYYVKTAKKWKKKVILHIHGAQYLEFYNESSQKKKNKIRDILNSSDIVIALSEEWKQIFDDTFKLNNCIVVKNGINPDLFKSAITCPELFQKSFLCLGRLGKRKGTYDLIEAVKLAKEIIPEIKVYIAGDGDIEKVNNIVKNDKLENNIKVIGWASFDKKIELLQHVSTVVLPSYNEGLPMSILEGMACGKAIISTTVGAIPEVVKKENGRLVKPGDIIALSNALIQFSLDKDFLIKAFEKNIELVEKQYSMKSMHEKLKNVYNNLTNNKTIN